MTTNKNTNTQSNNNNQRVVVNINTSTLHEHHKRKPRQKQKPNENQESSEPVQQQISNNHIYYPEQSLITNGQHTPIPPYMQSAITNRDMFLTSQKTAQMVTDMHNLLKNEYTNRSVPGGIPLAQASTPSSETSTPSSDQLSIGEASTPSSMHNNPLFRENELYETTPNQETPKPVSDITDKMKQSTKEASPTHSAGPYLPFLPENSPLMENNTNTPHQDTNSDFGLQYLKSHQKRYNVASGRYKKELKNELIELALKHEVDIHHPKGTSKYARTIYKEIEAKMKQNKK